MGETTPSMSLHPWALDDPVTYDRNVRGELTDAQRSYLRPGALAASNFTARVISVVTVLSVANPLARDGQLFLPHGVVIGIIVLLLVGSLPANLWALWLLRKDLADTSVRVTTATVRRRTIRGSDGRPLRSLSFFPPELAPGAYEVVHFPHSRVVLSARPTESEGVRDAGVTQELSELLGFTQEDLALNRAGQLSDGQRPRVRTSRAYTIAGWGAVAAALLTLAVAGFAGGGDAVRAAPALIFLAAAAAAFTLRRKAVRGESDPVIRVVEGDAQVLLDDRIGNLRVTIGGEVFHCERERISWATVREGRVSRSLFALPAGRYRAFALQDVLLSMEALDDTKEPHPEGHGS